MDDVLRNMLRISVTFLRLILAVLGLAATPAPSPSPTPSPFGTPEPTPEIDFSPAMSLQFGDIKAKAEMGDRQSEYQLGVRYYKGHDVGKDFAEAVNWFRKAAEQNHANAQFNLGFCYANGQGVTKDEAEAVK